MQRHTDGHGMSHDNIWYVRIIKWLDDDHLIARVNQSQDGGEDALGRSRSDHNAMCGVDIQIVEAPCMVDNSLAKRRGTGTGRILIILSSLRGLYQVHDDIRRRVKVGLSLSQVQRIILLRQRIYFGEDGGTKCGHTTS